MKCTNDVCDVVEHNSNYCPACKIDEWGEDHHDQSIEDFCDSQAAKDYEDWMHGGKQDDWDDNSSDPIRYRDNGEPIGYC
jgi:hypothetical protein